MLMISFSDMKTPKFKVVTEFLEWLVHRYDTEDKKLNVVRGHKHDYLGMNLDFSKKGEVDIDMIPYIKKIIEAFPEKNILHRLVTAFSRFVPQTRPNTT